MSLTGMNKSILQIQFPKMCHFTGHLNLHNFQDTETTWTPTVSQRMSWRMPFVSSSLGDGGEATTPLWDSSEEEEEEELDLDRMPSTLSPEEKQATCSLAWMATQPPLPLSFMAERWPGPSGAPAAERGRQEMSAWRWGSCGRRCQA